MSTSEAVLPHWLVCSLFSKNKIKNPRTSVLFTLLDISSCLMSVINHHAYLQIFLPCVSPVERAHSLWKSSWDWLVLQGSQSCLSSLRRSGVRRRGSKQSLLLLVRRHRRPGGPRREAEAGGGAPCWVALTLLEAGKMELELTLFGRTFGRSDLDAWKWN